MDGCCILLLSRLRDRIESRTLVQFARMCSVGVGRPYMFIEGTAHEHACTAQTYTAFDQRGGEVTEDATRSENNTTCRRSFFIGALRRLCSFSLNSKRELTMVELRLFFRGIKMWGQFLQPNRFNGSHLPHERFPLGGLDHFMINDPTRCLLE